MVFATLAFLGAFVADQGLLTYFDDLSDPGLPYAWATKVSEIGQQALVGAGSAEESQGRKDHGIPATYESMATKPWL